MKKIVTLLLCMLPVSLFAQVNDGIRQAMDNYDYETVVTLIEPDCQDSLLLITKAQALKAMNRYPEAIGVLNSLILKDSTNTKVLIDLAECYKLTGNSRRAANCYQKAMNLQPENKFFRLQFIRSLLASEDYEEARTACHGWLERDSLSATGYKYLGPNLCINILYSVKIRKIVGISLFLSSFFKSRKHLCHNLNSI